MNTRKSIIALATAGVLGSALLTGTGAFATDTTKAANEKGVAEVAVAASTDTDESSFIKTVDEAYKALREVRAARMAIFNGTPEDAVKLTGEAQKDLTMAQQSMKDHSLMTQKTTDDNDAYIPFDTSMSLAEGFVPDEEKKAALTTANEHLSKGEKSHAVNALKLANVDVSVSAAMIPAAASLKHVEDAIKLLGNKKYYEANLALKAIEDSVLVEVYDLNAMPVQGTATKG